MFRGYGGTYLYGNQSSLRASECRDQFIIAVLFITNCVEIGCGEY